MLHKHLVAKLSLAGHDVVTVNDIGLKGKSDHAIFESAIELERIVITSNCSDFVALADEKLAQGGIHPGVLLVYLYNSPSKDMTRDDIVQAIANLENTGVSLENTSHSLNKYKY